MTDAPLARIQEKRGEQFSEDAPSIGSILQITLDDAFWDMSKHPQQAHALPFLVFGTLFHKVIVVQLSGSRNIVFVEAL